MGATRFRPIGGHPPRLPGEFMHDEGGIRNLRLGQRPAESLAPQQRLDRTGCAANAANPLTSSSMSLRGSMDFRVDLADQAPRQSVQGTRDGTGCPCSTDVAVTGL